MAEHGKHKGKMPKGMKHEEMTPVPPPRKPKKDRKAKKGKK